MSRQFDSGGDPKQEALKVLPLVRQAIEEGLGRVTAASVQPGHELSPDRLAVLLDVEIPLIWQTDEEFTEGTFGFDLVTRARVTVKYDLGMTWIKAIVINNDEYKFYYTQNFIDKKAGDLREIADQARRAFFEHISKK